MSIYKFEISPELTHELVVLRGTRKDKIESELNCPEELVEKIINLANGNNIAKLAIALAMTGAIIQKVTEQHIGSPPNGMSFNDMVHIGTPLYERLVQSYFDESKKNRM